MKGVLHVGQADVGPDTLASARSLNIWPHGCSAEKGYLPTGNMVIGHMKAAVSPLLLPGADEEAAPAGAVRLAVAAQSAFGVRCTVNTSFSDLM